MSELMKSTQSRPSSGSISIARTHTSAIWPTCSMSDPASSSDRPFHPVGAIAVMSSGCDVRILLPIGLGRISGYCGPPNPVTTMPSIGSAGYVNGTVMNAERIPPAPSRRHRGAPAREAALSNRFCTRFGFVENPKIPCPAGFIPVRKDDHAVGVNAGNVERSGPNAPEPASLASVGSRPSHISRRTSS